MDKLERYADIIEKVLEEYASIPYSYGDVVAKVVFDRQHNRYLMVAEGWEDVKRVHGTIVHVEIIDGKVWIQQDGIEHGITGDLMEQGIPKHEIVLGFHPADIRPYTEYAVG